MDSDIDQRLSDLMKRAQDGDRQAYEALLVDAGSLVRSYVRKRLQRPDQLEDIVQETLLSIHAYRHTYDPRRSFRPWMYAIARHRLLDSVDKHKRRAANEVLGANMEELHGPQELTCREPRLGFLQQAFSVLSRTQREIIQLLKLDGYSVAEVAQKTGLSESLVKVSAHRGYKKLRAAIEESAGE